MGPALAEFHGSWHECWQPGSLPASSRPCRGGFADSAEVSLDAFVVPARRDRAKVYSSFLPAVGLRLSTGGLDDELLDPLIDGAPGICRRWLVSDGLAEIENRLEQWPSQNFAWLADRTSPLLPKMSEADMAAMTNAKKNIISARANLQLRFTSPELLKLSAADKSSLKFDKVKFYTTVPHEEAAKIATAQKYLRDVANAVDSDDREYDKSLLKTSYVERRRKSIAMKSLVELAGLVLREARRCTGTPRKSFANLVRSF